MKVIIREVTTDQGEVIYRGKVFSDGTAMEEDDTHYTLLYPTKKIAEQVYAGLMKTNAKYVEGEVYEHLALLRYPETSFCIRIRKN